MYKIGIIGADHPDGGELIRLLVNHPEVEIINLYAPSLTGRNVCSVHPGLIGEKIVNFSDQINFDDLNLVFIADSSQIPDTLYTLSDEMSDLKIIILDSTTKDLPFKTEIGLSEINRKALVRGATKAQLLYPVFVPIMISLYPLAMYMLLKNSLHINVEIPDGMKNEIGKWDEEKSGITEMLKEIQPSFNGNIILNFAFNHHDKRGIKISFELECSLSLEEIEKIYEGIYDDHNFTFTSFSPIETNEIAGTQKCVISISKTSPDKLNVEAVADGRLRGGAGDATHVMNLFFGLHEKTGLQLKTSLFGIVNK
ncbi:MAG: hypothetical protein J1E78_03170 [Muribaculaceae bacterium]|nr:hypothetical protein [Muribaculaceae bacterium]